MSRKKKFTLGVCLLLMLTLVVGNSLAWLKHDTNAVTNTFTMGKVDGFLDEATVDPNTGKKLTGELAGRTRAGNDYVFVPGRTIDKDPTVTVLSNSQDCYVRMRIKLENLDKLKTLVKQAVEGNHISLADFDWEDYVVGHNEDLWKRVAIIDNSEEDPEDTSVTVEYWYVNEVPSANTDTALPALFTGLKIPGWMNELAIFSEFVGTDGRLTEEIEIEADLIQSEGFKYADGATWDAKRAAMAGAWAAFEGPSNTAEEILERPNLVSAFLPTP